MAPPEEIHYDIDGQVALVTIDRPECLNALNDAAYARLWLLLRTFESDPTLRVAIVTGTGCARSRWVRTCGSRFGTRPRVGV